MNIVSWLDDAVCARLMLTFAHFLWQGVAIGLFVGLLGFLMRQRSAGARYLLFTSAMVAMVACPPLTYGLLSSPSQPMDEVADTELNSQSVDDSDQVLNARTGFPDGLLEDELDSTDALFSETPLVHDPDQITKTVESPIIHSEPADRPTGVRFLTCCYLLGVVLLLGRFVLGMQGAGRIRRSSRLLDDPDILREITRRAKALGLRNLPPVLLCQQLLVPAVVGMLRPAILFPVAMISGLTPQQVEDVLTHELAHIRRYDYLVNVMQRVVESFLFFHPAVWFVSRRIRIEREHCCDDMVISLGTAPVDYAAALLNVVQAVSTAESRMHLSQLAMLPAVGKRSELRRRIERLVNGHNQPQIYFTRKGIIMTSLTTTLVLAGSMLFSATFQADEEREDQHTAHTATQSENEAELPETIDASGLPEVASKNGFLTKESDSKNEEAVRNVSNASPAEGESSQKLREQREANDTTSIPAGYKRVNQSKRKPAHTKIFSLHFVNATSLSNVLNHAYKDSSLIIVRDPITNSLIISGTESNVKAIEGFIKLLDTKEILNVERWQKKESTGTENSDVPSKKTIKTFRNRRPDASSKSFNVFPIKWQKAEEVAKDLKDILKKINPSTDHQVISVLNGKNICVSGTSIDAKMVGALVLLLDRKPEEPAKSDSSAIDATLDGRLQKKNPNDSKPTRKSQTPEVAPAKTSSRDIKIFPLKYAVAGELSILLKDVYRDIEKSGLIGIATDPRTNTIIITSESESNLHEIAALIQVLDQKQDQLPGSRSNPLRSQGGQPGDPSKKSATKWPTAPRQAAAGMLTDLIQLTEAYSDAYRELQLAKAAYEVLKVQVKQEPDLVIEFTKAEVGINAAQRKLELFKQIAEAVIKSIEDGIKDLTEQLSTTGSQQVKNGLKRQLRDQQLRLDILKKLISR